ncbi:Uncharacterized protein YR821_2485 [Yersinia ruckeri]|uniref:Uncharacterized protein n=1 Tax=Yersinia ruckeri TaxID=29486 RepID=A0A0A8VL46_YERRU|nr:hypothetical protein yruck0001_32060 [Yersinia ruckeri ATCC 29473]QTD77403.1 Uncharacterized protein YR821_2485 [Yersinia ruckeri]CEK28316.1 hypothetical protein CSF007_12920 [Yersinia ruckeri]
MEQRQALMQQETRVIAWQDNLLLAWCLQSALYLPYTTL